jgi:protein involved in polysaccharide export with SLBB domain
MPFPASSVAGHPYVLQIGDEVAVSFYRNPELDESVMVRPDGKLSLKFVGDVPAEGKTPDAVADDIAARYRGELTEPHVTLAVRKAAGQRVYVGGEVARPGVQDLAATLTLVQAIEAAGGLAKTANIEQVVLVRRVADGSSARVVDVRDVLRGDHPESDVALEPYDIVFVPRSKVADVNLFVEQFIRNNLPVNPSMGIAAF